jgi:hypothetical protein
MHDLKASPHRFGVDGVDVGDLDGDLRYHRRRRILTHDADLSGRVARRHKRHDPAHVHGNLETKQAGVKLAALIRLVGGDVGHDPPDAHDPPS